MKQSNKQGFSVIVALLMVGFLLVVTVGVFNLVLRELNDNKGLGNYIKAYAGAESAQELALLKVKQGGYGYYDAIDFDINERSIILSDNPSDTSKFTGAKEAYISYDLNTKTSKYVGKLGKHGYDIIPLFYLTGSLNNPTEEAITSINFSISQGEANTVAWNIVSSNGGVSGIGGFDNDTLVDQKNLSDASVSIVTGQQIGNFLADNTTNYLILFNAGEEVEYNLSSGDENQYFTKPRTQIISRAKIGDYRQNIRTQVDNTEYLNVLKYSIYSN